MIEKQAAKIITAGKAMYGEGSKAEQQRDELAAKSPAMPSGCNIEAEVEIKFEKKVAQNRPIQVSQAEKFEKKLKN